MRDLDSRVPSDAPLHYGRRTARLVSTRAELGGLKKDCAVEIAVKAELDRAVQAMPLRERFAALRALHPLPPPAGEVADKAFFDDLSGE